MNDHKPTVRYILGCTVLTVETAEQRARLIIPGNVLLAGSAYHMATTQGCRAVVRIK